MFTGIVEELGEVVGKDDLGDSARFTIQGPVVTADAGHGDSIAVNGVCLTVVELLPGGQFTADVMGETLSRSSLGRLAAGSPVNLERAAALNSRLGGHIVQGHVDGTGQILIPLALRTLGGGQDRPPHRAGPLRRRKGLDHRRRHFAHGLRTRR